jgi:hypothetical protein
MHMTEQPRLLQTSPAALTGLVATAVVAYAVHTAAWITHQIGGAAAWPRWLELTYLITLFVWVGAFGLALYTRSRLRKAAGRPILGDERTHALYLRAHQVALLVVVLMQVPFFVVTIPTQALAQLTVTTALVVLFAAYAWLDR